jgi:hypothetical protein
MGARIVAASVTGCRLPNSAHACYTLLTCAPCKHTCTFKTCGHLQVRSVSSNFLSSTPGLQEALPAPTSSDNGPSTSKPSKRKRLVNVEDHTPASDDLESPVATARAAKGNSAKRTLPKPQGNDTPDKDAKGNAKGVHDAGTAASTQVTSTLPVVNAVKMGYQRVRWLPSIRRKLSGSNHGDDTLQHNST